MCISLQPKVVQNNKDSVDVGVVLLQLSGLGQFVLLDVQSLGDNLVPRALGLEKLEPEEEKNAVSLVETK